MTAADDQYPFDPDRVTWPPDYRVIPVGSHHRPDETPAAVGIMYVDGPVRPDASIPPQRDHRGRVVVGYNCLGTGWLVGANCRTAEQFAVVGSAAILTDMVHEVMETVRVDGHRVFDPHPGDGAEEQWSWLHRRIERLLRDYRREFPTPTRTVT